MIRCEQCGHESNFWSPRAVYACKAPHCRMHDVPICHNCLMKDRATTAALDALETCPFCGVGELRYLGNQ